MISDAGGILEVSLKNQNGEWALFDFMNGF